MAHHRCDKMAPYPHPGPSPGATPKGYACSQGIPTCSCLAGWFHSLHTIVCVVSLSCAACSCSRAESSPYTSSTTCKVQPKQSSPGASCQHGNAIVLSLLASGQASVDFLDWFWQRIAAHTHTQLGFHAIINNGFISVSLKISHPTHTITMDLTNRVERGWLGTHHDQDRALCPITGQPSNKEEIWKVWWGHAEIHIWLLR